MILYEQSVVWYVLGQLACLCSMAWQKFFPNLSEFLNQRNHSHSRITCSGVPLHAKHLSGFLSIPNLIMFWYVFWIILVWYFLGRSSWLIHPKWGSISLWWPSTTDRYQIVATKCSCTFWSWSVKKKPIPFQDNTCNPHCKVSPPER